MVDRPGPSCRSATRSILDTGGLHDGHLILKGKPTHYLTPTVIDRLVAGFKDLNDEQRLILQTPVGDPRLPDPNTATVEDLRRIASGTLQVEAAVEQYIVEPLLRLCFGATDGFRVERQYRIPGAGVADFAVHGPDGLAGVVEVKLGVQYRRDGGLKGSPDLEQVIRYAHAADVPALLIDSNDIIVIDRDGDEPSTSLDRRRLTDDHLAIIASHFNPGEPK